MIRPLALALLAMGAAAPAWAADKIACPAKDGAGRRLAVGRNGTLFFGDPAGLGSQAPDGLDHGANLFRLPSGGAGYVLVCNYEGASIGLSFNVPSAARVCRQDAHSFTCR